MIRDPWSLVHFFGSAFLYVSIYRIMPEHPIWASVFAIGLGVAWEVLDNFNEQCQWHCIFLDPTGGDVRDIIANGAGIIMAATMIWTTT